MTQLLNWVSRTATRQHSSISNRKLFALSVLIGVIAIVATYWRWLRPGLTVYGDWVYIPYDRLLEFLPFPSIWDASIDFGRDALNIAPLFPLDFAQGILAKFLGLDFSVTEKIIWYIPFLALVVFSPYYLVWALRGDRTASLYAAIFFSLNTYLIVIMSEAGHINTGVAYAISPLVFALFVLFLRAPSFRRSIALALALTIEITYDFRIAYITVAALGLYFGYNVMLNRTISIKIVANLALAVMVVGLLQAFWLLPWFFTAARPVLPPGYGDPSAVSALSFDTILHSLTTFHAFWADPITYFKVNPVDPAFFLVPTLVFAALLFSKANANIPFFALCSLAFAFLVKGNNEPAGAIYIWLFQNIPGFDTFRSPERFYAGLMLAYSVLIGFTVSEIYKRANRVGRWSGWVKTIVLMVPIVFVLYSMRSVIMQHTQGTFQTKSVPESYRLIEETIGDESEFFRILWFPGYHDTMYRTGNHPAIAPGNTVFGEAIPNVGYGLSLLNQKYWESFLNLASVKYVIVPDDYDGSLFRWFPRKREDYVKMLEQVEGLTKTDYAGATVFRNLSYRPLIYVTSNAVHIRDVDGYGNYVRGQAVWLPDTLPSPEDVEKWGVDSDFIVGLRGQPLAFQKSPAGEKSTPGLSVTTVNATRYWIRINRASEPYVLVFNQAFHTEWKAYVDGKSLPESNHFVANGYFNAWYIDELGDYDVIIEYRPQRLAYLGLVISIMSFLAAVWVVRPRRGALAARLLGRKAQRVDG